MLYGITVLVSVPEQFGKLFMYVTYRPCFSPCICGLDVKSKNIDTPVPCSTVFLCSCTDVFSCDGRVSGFACRCGFYVVCLFRVDKGTLEPCTSN